MFPVPAVATPGSPCQGQGSLIEQGCQAMGARHQEISQLSPQHSVLTFPSAKRDLDLHLNLKHSNAPSRAPRSCAMCTSV